MSQLHDALALAARLHERGAVTYREYIELHKALTAAQAQAEHTVTLEFSDHVNGTMTCHAAPDADCRRSYYDDGHEPESYGGDYHPTAAYNEAPAWDELVIGGPVMFPIYPFRAADAEDCWEYSLSPGDGAS